MWAILTMNTMQKYNAILKINKRNYFHCASSSSFSVKTLFVVSSIAKCWGSSHSCCSSHSVFVLFCFILIELLLDVIIQCHHKMWFRCLCCVMCGLIVCTVLCVAMLEKKLWKIVVNSLKVFPPLYLPSWTVVWFLYWHYIMHISHIRSVNCDEY